MSFYREVTQCPDDYLLQIVNIAVNISSPIPQVNDGVNNKLARAMIGNIASPVGEKEGYTLFG
jgi:hypothetical protein